MKISNIEIKRDTWSLAEMFLGRCFESIQQIQRRTPMCQSVYNSFSVIPKWNRTLAWLFSRKFAAYIQNTFLEEHLYSGELLLKENWLGCFAAVFAFCWRLSISWLRLVFFQKLCKIYWSFTSSQLEAHSQSPYVIQNKYVLPDLHVTFRWSSEKYSVRLAWPTLFFWTKKPPNFGLENRKIPLLQFLKISDFFQNCLERKL